MEVKDKDDRYMHSRLPIGANEKILAIYKHHWFAYVSLWFIGLFLIVCIMGIASFLVFVQGAGSSTVSDHKTQIFAVATVFSAAVALFTFIPVYLRMQEQVCLTEEALLQILQPTLFASKISQLNLQHIADVSVRQDVLGTLFGFGKISVETPGEQDNYEFSVIPSPQKAARQIIDAHENYQAALQAGRLPSTLSMQTEPAAQPQTQAAPPVDPQQYQQFLAYQKMVAQQQQDQPAGGQAPAGQSPVPPAEPESSEPDNQK